ncbi:TonB-dependent receptor plug domain-containing protein [Hymenobacter perfusus]|uniref:TonB-dependent receptor plug domain-containing protein n=1 Tax=Hymenobacter perfusus TaxID=1236770 RepID=A0A3R9UVT3_9BACT|nr:TonB-dependent receptor plug domain-containing protein [Hymenobacter perfusus]RSK41197.1 hypothetical protein EI293_17380 [Hymenobacter perfusus]
MSICLRLVAILLLAHTTLHAQTGVPLSSGQAQHPDITAHKPIQIRLICTSSIRPGNEPLWVVDGLPISAEQIKTIIPDNIKKIDVLQNAQAMALYGTRAANGAVLITMKSAAHSRITKQKRPVN